MKYIVKFFPEITIKSKSVRKKMVRTLLENIRAQISVVTKDFIVKNNWDNISVEINDDSKAHQVEETLRKITGIANFIRVLEFPYISFQDVYDKVAEIYLPKIEWKTFVARVNRSWIHDFKSIDLERFIGGWLLKNSTNAKVKLKGADVTALVEVKSDKFYIVEERIEGIWGFPVWLQDSALSLLSGWFDSPVASFEMIKRWVKVDYLFFNLWGTAHELWVKQLAHYLWSTYQIRFRWTFITVNFEEVVKELLTKVDHRYRGVILKRLMFKVADKIVSKGKYSAIVTGEAVGQVSSQTLINLDVISKATDKLILRPLVTADKEDIIRQSRKIGTHDFSLSMPEYCGVISDRPSTCAKLANVLKEEENLSPDLIDNAYNARKQEDIRRLFDSVSEISEVEVVHEVSENQVVIDIREEDKIKKDPLDYIKWEVIEIPFYDINKEFKNLDSSKTYLLFCDKWVLSNLHALYLKDKGYENIKVLRP